MQRTSDGDFDSRYTRLMLADGGTDAKESYREYYSSEDPTRQPPAHAHDRPRLGAPVTAAAAARRIGQHAQGDAVEHRARLRRRTAQSNIDRVVDFIVSKRPDIISFNEIMRYSSSSQPQMIADKLARQTGQTWTYKWVQKSGASSGEGECVMTQLDVDATDDLPAERRRGRWR